jgi:hypothetical protein
MWHVGGSAEVCVSCILGLSYCAMSPEGSDVIVPCMKQASKVDGMDVGRAY